MAKRSHRKSHLNPRPVPVPTDESIVRMRHFCRIRFGALPCPITHVSRARTLTHAGFAADVQLFDGSRAILIVRYVRGHDPDERWCMRGKYRPDGPSSFIFDEISQRWVRYYPEDDQD